MHLTRQLIHHIHRSKPDPNTMYKSGTPSNTVTVQGGQATAPKAPTNLKASLQNGPSVNLTWTDNATNETGFVIERSTDGINFSQIATPGPNSGTNGTYTDTTIAAGNTYTYRVNAVNGTASSGYSTAAPVTVPAAGVPATPTGLTVNSNLSGGTTDIVFANWKVFQERA